MFNSRDTFTNFNPNRKEIIEVPYEIGTIIELKDNPNVLAKICQYRITVEHYAKVIIVGLSSQIYGDKSEIEKEISIDELEEKWEKTSRIIIGKLDSENFIHIPGFSECFEKTKKLELTRKKK